MGSLEITILGLGKLGKVHGIFGQKSWKHGEVIINLVGMFYSWWTKQYSDSGKR